MVGYVLAMLTGCGVTYYDVRNVGGELSLSLTPSGDEGVTLDLTRAGAAEGSFEGYYDCPEPQLFWSTDHDGTPLWGQVVACAESVDVTGPCGSAVSLRLDAEPDLTYLELGSVTSAAPRLTVLEHQERVEYGPSGSIALEVLATGGCLTGPTPHDLVLTWDFPIRDERRTRERSEWPIRFAGGPEPR